MSVVTRRIARAASAKKTSTDTPPQPDTGPLKITNVAYSSTGGNLTVTWQTNKNADSYTSLYYGPAKHCTWNWQLSGTIDTTADAQVYDFDAFDNGASVVSTLKAKNIYTIAYFSAGTFEDWRSDAASFPASVKGNEVDGWAGENWLDVRALDVLRPIMENRADIAKAKGFNAIEWDNVDGYQNTPGFPFTQADQVAYNKMIAQVAHERGLAVFLKNDGDDVGTLQPYFEGSVAEQPYQYSEAAVYKPFSTANKPVLICEYKTPSAANQTNANTNGYSLIYHTLNLDKKYLASYVTNPAPAITLTDTTSSPVRDSSMTMTHSMTFSGLTPGQQYGFLLWSTAGTEKVYDSTPRTFIAA